LFCQGCPKNLFCSLGYPEAELFISEGNIPQREFFHLSEPHYKKPLVENPGTYTCFRLTEAIDEQISWDDRFLCDPVSLGAKEGRKLGQVNLSHANIYPTFRLSQGEITVRILDVPVQPEWFLFL
jgi:hypothetical protein